MKAVRLLALAMSALLPLEATAATFDWQEATARLAAEGQRAEVCAQEIKRYGDAAELEQAKTLYELARTELTTARQGLVDVLTGDDTGPTLADLEAALSRSIEARVALCNQAWKAKPGIRGEKSAIIDLGSDFRGQVLDSAAAIHGSGQALDPLTRSTIQTQLGAVSSRNFDAATAGIDRVIAYAPDSDEPPDEFTRIEVYFGTDRENEGTAAEPDFLAGRAHQLQLGKVQVTVPKNHLFANVERPGTRWFVFSEDEDPKEHFTIQKTLLQEKDAFTAELQALVGDAERYPDQAFVFVHGYRVTFEAAAYRAAQIAYDLRFDGAPLFYSWPSKGAFEDYTYDQNSVRQARAHLESFLDLVRTESGARIVHLIAHSMGNDPLMEVLAAMQRTNPDPGRPLFNQIVLAAPDIDRDLFVELAQQVQGVAAGLTLYASANDWALEAAKLVARGVPRAGDVPESGPVVVDGLDTIDASALGTDFFSLNHSDYADHPILLNDIGVLMKTGLNPPDARLIGLRPAGEPSSRYWVYPRF